MDPLQKITKKTNGFFLCLIIVHLAASMIVSMLALGAVEIGTFTVLLLTQLLLLVPSFVFILAGNPEVFTWLRFKRLKTGTVFLIILFTFLTMPFISLINIISQLFTTNTVVEMSEEFAGMPAAMVVFMVGLFGPFCEEFAFRGIIFGGFRRAGAVLAGAVLSAVYFGLMHLNLNQMSYAIVLGVIFCLLVEGTGSIWASMIAHAVINTWNVILLLAMDKAYSSMGLDIFAIAEETATTDQKLAMIGILLVVSMFSSAMALGVFIAVCRHEGRWENIVAMFCRPERLPDRDGIAEEPVPESDPYETAEEYVPESDLYEAAEEPDVAGYETGTKSKVRLLTPSGCIAIALCIFVIFFLDKLVALFT